MKNNNTYRIVLLVLLIVFVPFVGCKRDVELAEKYIKEMKDGAVLVRLKTSKLQIDKLLEMGKLDLAKEKVMLQRKKNLEIVTAFSEHFKFCRVYFFHSNNSELVKENRTRGFFLDANLNVDETIRVIEKNVFVVDIGDLFFDTFSSHSEGIGVMKQNFELLIKPFPYYIGKSRVLPVFKRSTSELVELLNEELNAFYLKAAK